MEQMEQPQPKSKKSLHIVPAKKKKAPRIVAVPLTQEQRNTASQHIWQLFSEWEQSTELSNKTIRDLRKEVKRWSSQIIDGKARGENLDTLFAKKAETSVMKTMTKNRASIQDTMDALQELISAYQEWKQEKTHSVADHAKMLPHIRKLIHEIEYGNVKNVVERFNNREWGK